MPKTKLMAKVTSLRDLRDRATTDEQYRKLAIAAAENLGGGPAHTASLDLAMRWLRINADETDERGVIAEVNFCRDLV
jgi:hypothetical protein